MKIAVIGDLDSLMGFKALGLSVFAVSSSQEALAQIQGMLGGDYAALFLTENYAAPLLADLTALEKEITLYPSIVIIPSHHGSQGLGMEKTKLMIERAIGISFNQGEQ